MDIDSRRRYSDARSINTKSYERHPEGTDHDSDRSVYSHLEQSNCTISENKREDPRELAAASQPRRRESQRCALVLDLQDERANEMRRNSRSNRRPSQSIHSQRLQGQHLGEADEDQAAANGKVIKINTAHDIIKLLCGQEAVAPKKEDENAKDEAVDDDQLQEHVGDKEEDQKSKSNQAAKEHGPVRMILANGQEILLDFDPHALLYSFNNGAERPQVLAPDPKGEKRKSAVETGSINSGTQMNEHVAQVREKAKQEENDEAPAEGEGNKEAAPDAVQESNIDQTAGHQDQEANSQKSAGLCQEALDKALPSEPEKPAQPEPEVKDQSLKKRNPSQFAKYFNTYQ